MADTDTSWTLPDVTVTPQEDYSKYMIQPGGQGNNYQALVDINEFPSDPFAHEIPQYTQALTEGLSRYPTAVPPVSTNYGNSNWVPVDHQPDFSSSPQSVFGSLGQRLGEIGSSIGGAFSNTAQNYLQDYAKLTGQGTETGITQMEPGDAASFVAQHILSIPGGAGVLGAGPKIFPEELSGLSKEDQINKIQSKISWDPDPNTGLITLARGGESPKEGPTFLTSDAALAHHYSDEGYRPILTYQLDKSKLLDIDSSEFTKHFPNAGEGPSLFVETPPEVLSYLKKNGYAGLTSSDGGIARIDFPQNAISEPQILLKGSPVSPNSTLGQTIHSLRETNGNIDQAIDNWRAKAKTTTPETAAVWNKYANVLEQNKDKITLQGFYPKQSQPQNVFEPITAYHGTAYPFEQFDPEKIGFGEGNAEHGYGFYFSGDPDEAGHYRDFVRDNWNSMLGQSGKPSPAIVESHLNVNPEHLMDWFQPLSTQSDFVKTGLKKLGATDDQLQSQSGKGYDSLKEILGTKDDKQISESLSSVGIPGLKYGAYKVNPPHSRITNYVISNPNLINIIKRYGLAGLGIGAAQGSNFFIPTDHNPGFE